MGDAIRWIGILHLSLFIGRNRCLDSLDINKTLSLLFDLQLTAAGTFDVSSVQWDTVFDEVANISESQELDISHVTRRSHNPPGQKKRSIHIALELYGSPDRGSNKPFYLPDLSESRGLQSIQLEPALLDIAGFSLG